MKQRAEKKLIRVLKLICISLNLVLVQGHDASVLLGLLKDFIPINSLFLRVCSKVFNLSLPFSFLSLSLWLCYYRFEQENFEHIWSKKFFFNNFINKIRTKWFFQLLIRRWYLSLLNEMNMTLLNPTQPIKRVIHLSLLNASWLFFFFFWGCRYLSAYTAFVGAKSLPWAMLI